MSKLSSFLSHLSTYLPYIIIGIIVIALAILIVVTLTTSRAIRNAGKRRMPGPTTAAAQTTLKKKSEKLSQKIPPIGGRLSELLSLKGFFHVGDISLSFLRALDLLRHRIDVPNFKYRLPWYLLIGPSNSGKTSLMDCSEQVFPLGKPDFGIKDYNPACRWWFLNRGIVIDVKGHFLISEDGNQSDENGWRTIIALLSRYRAKRPLDGIILTIPASELYGTHKLHLDNIADRAHFLAQKLSATQSHLGIQVPVYVVITKSDIIPGFKSLCQAIPLNNRQNMLGWSCPYTLNTAYDPSWINEAFHSIQQQCHQIRLEILAECKDPDVQEGVFIFPSEVSHIQNHLKPYLDSIFKATSYEDSLLLRGIYFCGDAGNGIDLNELKIISEDQDISLEDEAASLLTNEERESNQQYKEEKDNFIKLRVGEIDEETREKKTHHIFFFNDVLNRKIFAEIGLSRPIQHRFRRMNRNLNIAKGTMASFMVIGTLGIMNAYDRLSQNRDYLLPVLGKINSILHEIPVYRSSHSSRGSVPLFENQSRQLLDMMENIEHASFFSIFMPSTWFSSLSHKLQTSLKASYDQIVLRTIYMDLLIKMRDVLTARPSPHDVTASLGIQLQPTYTVEYNLFKNYVDRFIDLYINIDKYNRLKENSDPELIKELIAYTLGFNLPKEFIDNYKHFHKLLHEVPYPKIDLVAYHNTALETLRSLYFYFLNNLFSPANSNSIIGRMHELLQIFGHKGNRSAPSVDELRRLSKDLNQFILTLGQPGKNWIDAPYFDPDPSFSELMTQINQFSLFGPSVVQQFAGQTSIAFQGFHQELTKLNTLLIDKSDFKSNQPAYYSDGLFALQKGLDLLFQQPFMVPSTGEKFNAEVPENQIVFWNTKMIDQATDLVQGYDDFMTKQVSNLPHGIRETLRHVALHNLEQNIVSLIARAQTYSIAPAEQGSALAAEETLRDKISDVRVIAPKFLKLLQVLGHGNIGETYVELRTLLGTLSTRLLTQVQTILDSYGLYRSKRNTFDWWDGLSSPAFEGFSARDSQDIKLYLDQQYHLVRQLALDFAEPMVTFLTSPVMKEFQGNLPLVVFWQRLIEQVKAYDKKRSGNSVSDLEDFLSKTMVDIELKTCLETLKKGDNKKTSGDFFVDQRLQLKRKLMNRCEILIRQENIDNYKKLVETFNHTLKGKFPFIAGNITPSTPEADPDDIRAFFKLYNEFGGDAETILDQIHQLGGVAADPLKFLTSLESVKAFFDNYLSASDESTTPSFDFNVDFRTNRDREVNGNLIIEWAFSPNDTTKITNHDKKRMGRWVHGDTATLSLRWPKSSTVKPFQDKAQPLMTVDDENHTASFSFPGKWSLLWLIWKHSADGSDFSNMKDTSPYTLRFEIPNGPEEKTVIYNRITLLASGNGKTPGKPLMIPSFPTRAPELSDDIVKKASKPLLTATYMDDLKKKRVDDSSETESEKKDSDKKSFSNDEEKKNDDSDSKPKESN